ncbi:integral membrane protein [Verticillium alfalfae VaMs.102]|uniref:Integral membrane protein n=1 Tax=Verticillium alfalfae (strain VaMs.102 / ATCC MYA-4576 / FGSC 10136) TaxID=526221 RepID=C9SR56_VERA1|nr:integral membrane protein [Verticillium alfalfae VaMs.102]EEY20858.1 integral membrane protein [Verticillium alfalfae VaMs.102]
MAARSMIPFLVGMMLLTGCCNTILTKYQDMQCVRNCDHPDVSRRAYFNQPVLQTAQMFVGEMGCWLVVGIMALWRRYVSRSTPQGDGYEAVSTDDTHADEARAALVNDTSDRGPATDDEIPDSPRLRGRLLLLLALPAVSDICGTTLMNIGLLLVVASIYQMTRGALVLFVGLFSVVFLRRHLHLFQWLSLAGVVTGVAIVGLAGAIYHEETDDEFKGDASLMQTVPTSSALLSVIGVLLIAGAQIFTATQFVLEEWILERWAIEPIQVVGWEGLFGFVVTLVAMVVLHVAVGSTDAGRYGFFDMAEGWRQMTSDRRIAISSLLIMISIGGFNFFGLSVTRSVSATSRSTIDTCRTLFIWIVSLGLRWETFKWLQVVGFALLVYFTFVFNGIVQPPFKALRPDEEIEELLPEDPIQH